MRKACLSILGLDLALQLILRLYGKGVSNQGISFGWLSGSGLWQVTATVSIIAIGFLVGLNLKRSQLWVFLLILGGLGNLIPRLVWGSVWDYIHLPWLAFSFNLSDVLISLGVISYILDIDGNINSIRRRTNPGNQ